MTKFDERDIAEAFASEATLGQFRALGVSSTSKEGYLTLTLDDQLVTDKKDIKSTNGR